MKKNYKDFSKEELNTMVNIIKKVGIKKYSKHCKERMAERKITIEDIKGVLEAYTVIEFHRRKFDDGNYSDRLLLRGKKVDSNNEVTCISLDIKNGMVVTCYKNKVTNNHYSPYSNYDKRNTANLLKGYL